MLLALFVATPAAASAAGAPQAAAPVVSVFRADTEKSGCTVDSEVQQAVNHDTALPVTRWASASNSMHSRLDGKAISDLPQKMQRNFIDSGAMSLGNLEFSGATQILEMASQFCPAETVGSKLDFEAGKMGKSLFGGNVWMWPALVVAIAIFQAIWQGRRQGRLDWRPIGRTVGVLSILSIALAGAANSTSAKYDSKGGVTSPGTFGTGSPGWMIDQTSQAVGIVSNGITSGMSQSISESFGGSEQQVIAKWNKMSCINYTNNLIKSYQAKYKFSGMLGTSSTTIPVAMNSLWMETGLRSYTDTQFGNNNAYGWQVNCRALEWNRGTSSEEQLAVQTGQTIDKGILPGSIWHLFNNPASTKPRDQGPNDTQASDSTSGLSLSGEALKQSPFYGDSAGDNQRYDMGIFASAMCAYDGSKWQVMPGWKNVKNADHSGDKVTKDGLLTAEGCKKLYAEGNGDGDANDTIVDWEDGNKPIAGLPSDGSMPDAADASPATGATANAFAAAGMNPRNFLTSVHGYGGVGNSMTAMLYPLTGLVMLLVFGGLGMVVFGVKFALVLGVIAFYFVAAWALVKGMDHLIKFAKTMLGLVVVSVMFGVILNIIVVLTQVFNGLGQGMGVTASGIGAVLWTALCPLFAVLAFRMFWQKFVKAPDPMSLRGGASYLRQAGNGSMGGHIAGAMERYAPSALMGGIAGRMAGRAAAAARPANAMGGAGGAGGMGRAGVGGMAGGGRRGGMSAFDSGFGPNGTQGEAFAGGMSGQGDEENSKGMLTAAAAGVGAKGAAGADYDKNTVLGSMNSSARARLLEQRRREGAGSASARVKEGRQLNRELNSALVGETGVGRALANPGAAVAGLGEKVTRKRNGEERTGRVANFVRKDLAMAGAAANTLGAKRIGNAFASTNTAARLANAREEYKNKTALGKLGTGAKVAGMGAVGALAVGGAPAAILAAGGYGAIKATKAARSGANYASGSQARRMRYMRLSDDKMRAVNQAAGAAPKKGGDGQGGSSQSGYSAGTAGASKTPKRDNPVGRTPVTPVTSGGGSSSTTDSTGSGRDGGMASDGYDADAAQPSSSSVGSAPASDDADDAGSSSSSSGFRGASAAAAAAATPSDSTSPFGGTGRPDDADGSNPAPSDAGFAGNTGRVAGSIPVRDGGVSSVDAEPQRAVPDVDQGRPDANDKAWDVSDSGTNRVSTGRVLPSEREAADNGGQPAREPQSRRGDTQPIVTQPARVDRGAPEPQVREVADGVQVSREDVARHVDTTPSQGSTPAPSAEPRQTTRRERRQGRAREASRSNNPLGGQTPPDRPFE